MFEQQRHEAVVHGADHHADHLRRSLADPASLRRHAVAEFGGRRLHGFPGFSADRRVAGKCT
jgi:hypothetical protein